MLTKLENSQKASDSFDNNNSFIFLLDEWKTKSDLLKKAKNIIKTVINTIEPHIFVYHGESDIYLDSNTHSIFAIPSASSLITAIREKYEIGQFFISLDDIKNKLVYEDVIVLEMLESYYSCSCLIPIVHLTKLISFILIEDLNFKTTQDTQNKLQQNISFFKDFSERFKLNLSSILFYENGHHEIAKLTKYSYQFGYYNTLTEFRTNFLHDIHTEVPFDKGVYYRYSQSSNTLQPVVWYGLAQRPPVLEQNQGISGMVLATQHIVFEEDRFLNPSLATIREEQFLTNAVISIPITYKEKKFGVLSLMRDTSKNETFSVLALSKLRVLTSFLANEMHNRFLHDEIDNGYFNTIISLSHLIEAKDKYTAGHSERVMIYAMNMAYQMSIPNSQYNILQYAALLHDIGKIGIPDNILLKPSALTDSESEIMRKHPMIAYSILKDLPHFEEISKIILYHHERIDGTGYYQITDIPQLSLILSVADIYDALTSDRPYRRAMKQSDALDIMKKMVGTVFPEDIYQALIRFLQTNPKEINFTDISIFDIM